jgi:hypothetical protein
MSILEAKMNYIKAMKEGLSMTLLTFTNKLLEEWEKHQNH